MSAHFLPFRARGALPDHFQAADSASERRRARENGSVPCSASLLEALNGATRVWGVTDIHEHEQRREYYEKA